MATPANRGAYLFGEFQLNLDLQVLTRSGNRVALGSKAFSILTCLVVHTGEVVTKAELLKTIWPESFVEEATLAQHIFSLRKALGDAASFVITVPGQGYRFTGTVRHIPSSGFAGRDILHEVQERTHMVIEEPMLPAPALRSSGRLAYVTLGLAVFVAGGLFAGWTWHKRAMPGEFHSVVVADFANTTNDSTYDQTMRRALEIDLEQSPSLDVMGEGDAVGILQSMGKPADSPVNGDVAREICVRDNREILLSGAIATLGNSFLLTLTATDCHSGKNLGGAKATANSKDDVLSALDSIAERMRSQIGESAKSLERYEVPINLATTTSLEALKDYSIAMSMEDNNKDERDILVFYQRAVELDPNFAMAYGGMANSYYNLNEYDLSEQYFKKAYELSSRVNAKEKLILDAASGGGVNDGLEAIKAYKLWGTTYPHDTAPWVNICNNYTQLGQDALGVYAGEHATQMNPDFAVGFSVLVRAYKRLGEYDKAKAAAARLAARGKDAAAVHISLFDIASYQHDTEEMARQVAWARDYGDSWAQWVMPSEQADVAMASGQFKSAQGFFQASVDTALKQNLTEASQDVLEDDATHELEIGLPDAARATVARLTNQKRDSVGLVVVQAELGDPSNAERFLKAHEAESHPGTTLAKVDMPRVRATLALEHGKPLDAIKALEPAAPYEMASFTIPYLRASAYMKAGQPQNAIHEYRKILDHQGSDVPTPLYALSYLGLARANVAASDPVSARAAYKSFLEAWKDADYDLPPLKAARQELAALR